MKQQFAAALFASLAACAFAGDPLSALDDEFDAATLGDFQRVITVESWPNDQLEVLDINTVRPGWLTMMPYTNGWYEDYRGNLVFKTVSDDFVVTTSAETTNRAATGAPNRSYSLAGIMIRAPRAITPGTWTAGGEKYSFLSIGSASNPGTYQYEVKSTSNEDELPNYSQLDIYATDCSCGESIIQTARIGQYVIQIAKTPTGPWRVINRYRRPDLPSTLQVGLVAYTDWDNVVLYTPEVHNVTTITHVAGDPMTPTQPDLIAQFDYLRFVTPSVPAEFVGIDLADPMEITDEELLSFLGENALSTPSSVPVELWMSY